MTCGRKRTTGARGAAARARLAPGQAADGVKNDGKRKPLEELRRGLVAADTGQMRVTSHQKRQHSERRHEALEPSGNFDAQNRGLAGR